MILVGLSLCLGYYVYKGPTYQILKSTDLSFLPHEDKQIYSQNATLQALDETVLFEKNSDEKIKPASLTKIMTAILAIEACPDLTQTIRTNGHDMTNLYYEGASIAGFPSNEEVTIEDLLYGLMLPSGADASVTLSKEIAGGDSQFAELMNQKAKALGMKDTHFTNSYGTESPDQFSTVNDLAILLQYALKNKTFKRVFTAKTYTGVNYSFESTLFKKLGNPSIKKGKILGGKTGYTEEAGLCLASLAIVDGKEYILITVGAKGDHKTKQFNMIDAKTIYNFI